MSAPRAEPPELPLLRYRDGDEDGYFAAPVTILGRVIRVGDDVVTISVGHGLETQLYVEDFYTVLGSPEDALGIFIDAAVHGDLATIHLGHDRLTYDNPHQLERYRV